MTLKRHRLPWLIFGLVFGLCLALGGASALEPAHAAPALQDATPGPSYAGPESCAKCHADLVESWKTTLHSQAFSSPIFQRDWTKEGSQAECLSCHTTGYDTASGQYAYEGVTCESCHGPFQAGHPQSSMPVKPDADLCANCHETTTDEWHASVHGQKGIQCEACHNPHTQTPKASTVTELCANCHKERGSSFTHGTHANAGLECSNCHMYTKPRVNDPIGGLVATGHTFSVGSDACVGCHQDTVHTRDKIVALSGEVEQINTLDAEALKQKVQEQDAKIADLEASSAVRLYTGLAQGAIVGLLTGAVAAFIVSRRIKVVEVDEDGKENQS